MSKQSNTNVTVFHMLRLFRILKKDFLHPMTFDLCPAGSMFVCLFVFPERIHNVSQLW